MQIHQQLKKYRLQQHLTQRQIAQILHVGVATYSKYERGQPDIPLKHLLTLCRFYQISPSALLPVSKTKSNIEEAD